MDEVNALPASEHEHYKNEIDADDTRKEIKYQSPDNVGDEDISSASSNNALFSSIAKEDNASMKNPLKLSAFNLSSVTTSPFSIKVIFSRPEPALLNIGFTVFQNFMLSVYLFRSRFAKYFVLSFFANLLVKFFCLLKAFRFSSV